MLANTSILSSVLFLTLLILVGLFFFIRASVKDRTKQIELLTEAPEAFLSQLQTYFEGRAYHITDEVSDRLILEGLVRPSRFLALFLSVLAATGLLCLALVLSFLFSAASNLFFVLPLLAPAAGVFYWKKAERVEQVELQVTQTPLEQKSQITVTAHRDELIQLQQALPLLEGRRD